MTTNQIEFAKHKEGIRHNRATESQTDFSMRETQRHNLEQERTNWFTTNWQKSVGEGNVLAALRHASAAQASAMAAQSQAAAAHRQAAVAEAYNPARISEAMGRAGLLSNQAALEGAKLPYADMQAKSEFKEQLFTESKTGSEASITHQNDKAWPWITAAKIISDLSNLGRLR